MKFQVPQLHRIGMTIHNWHHPKPATPIQRVDANACSDNARIAVQLAETSHVQWQRNGAAMQVESTDFPIQNVELMQSNSIQTAYTSVPMPTQCSENLALRRSNVDGNFYSHEFDHEEMVQVMDEERSQTKTRVIDTQPRRVRPDPFQIPNGSLRERALPSARVQELAEPLQTPFHHGSNGSLRERTLPSVRVQELVEPSQSRNGSLRERSSPGVRVQELAEHTMDELRQLAVELNRRLGLMGIGSGPANGFYPAQLAEQGMPSVVRPVHDPNAHIQISSGNVYGLYPDGTPVIYPHVTETPEIHYPVRADKGQHVLSSRPRSTPDHVQEYSRQEVMRHPAADQPPLGRVELALIETIYRYVQRAPEGVAERPSNSPFGFVSHPETNA